MFESLSNYVIGINNMEILLIIAMIIGLINAYKNIYDTRIGLKDGVKESKNLIDFIFLNK